MNRQFYDIDPWLDPYRTTIKSWIDYYHRRKEELTGGNSLADFASGHLHYGFHHAGNSLAFREWAPSATDMYMIGSFTGWEEKEEYRFRRKGEPGDWELELPPDSIRHGDLYKLSVHWKEGSGQRIPSYARYLVQDEHSKIFSCSHWMPEKPYRFRNTGFIPQVANPLVYEAHIGMSSEEEKVSTFSEFRKTVLPKIAASGYNTLQLMAIQEHPYYGSFGYHVSSFFAVSSRFGTPDDLRELVDEAHGLGLAVIMDLVHSHSVSNVNEGLGLFDGNPGQYFHTGDRRIHKAWDSLCFDYGKDHVVHFLLSNCRYWIEEYGIDGFRFDGITSMLYYDHGLERNFTSYDMYFDGGQDIDALTYLRLANDLVHEIKPGALNIAEEMSGMPGVACPASNGGMGFNFRLAMGVPDYWIKLIKEQSDESWNMDALFHELSQHRPEESTISYCESHDQALVGDKTLIFRLIDSEMYSGMDLSSTSLVVERGIALHKMIRLVTLTTAQSGYLNFMGNEFGHPEWIDFPRAGNDWSYKYARRQWSLADNVNLRYHHLGMFDRRMIDFVRSRRIFESSNVIKIAAHNNNNILAYRRANFLFVFNFHPSISFTDYGIPVRGKFRIVFDTDDPETGGFDRIDRSMTYYSVQEGKKISVSPEYVLRLYLPTRTAIVLEEIPVAPVRSHVTKRST